MKIAERTKARAISETKYTRGISGVYLCRPLLSMTLIVGEGSLPKERGELRTFCINENCYAGYWCHSNLTSAATFLRVRHAFLPHLATCQKISRGEEGGWNRGRVTTFWDSEKGGVMKNGRLKDLKTGRVMQIYARDHVEVHPKKKN